MCSIFHLMLNKLSQLGRGLAVRAAAAAAAPSFSGAVVQRAAASAAVGSASCFQRFQWGWMESVVSGTAGGGAEAAAGAISRGVNGAGTVRNSEAATLVDGVAASYIHQPAMKMYHGNWITTLFGCCPLHLPTHTLTTPAPPLHAWMWSTMTPTGKVWEVCSYM